MQLIIIELILEQEAKPIPFYGGVLHGILAQPAITALLPKEAVINVLAPPVSLGASKRHDSLAFQFGVVMHNVSSAHVDQWMRQLTTLFDNKLIHLAGVACRIKSHRIVDPDTLNMVAPDHAVTQLDIQWLTPTLISTSYKQASGLDRESPSLSSVVNSVIHRIAQIEPQRALRLGYAKETWRQTIQKLHQVKCTEDQTTFFKDAYTSSRGETKFSQRPVVGCVGVAKYEGHIEPFFLKILQWGQWFGAGQGVSQGRGSYRLITAF